MACGKHHGRAPRRAEMWRAAPEYLGMLNHNSSNQDVLLDTASPLAKLPNCNLERSTGSLDRVPDKRVVSGLYALNQSIDEHNDMARF